MIELSVDEARRVAVAAQLLTADRPTDLVATVHRLTFLQLDPTAAVAPSADLVAWSRLGGTYRPEHLTRALDERRLFELGALVRPMSDVGLYLAVQPRPDSGASRWLEANDGFRRDVLARLRDAGPLQSRDIPDTAQVPWQSTGWTHQRNVTQMLEILAVRGQVAIAGRVGRQRLWDLPERVYPADVAVPTAEEAAHIRDERRLASLGIARDVTVAVPVEPITVGAAGEPATVAGVPGRWRVDPAALAVLDRAPAPRTALLSPFDRLIHDRVRAQQLFGYEYVLEMYKPADQRRWGYFALPVLHGNRLVGKLDAKADRKAGRLVVQALHEDLPLDADARDAVGREVQALADWLGLAPPG
ncbi:hypothetical protein N867_06890 [Actinotalea fermentans ATCC 43279 = JCM 9966 = DSM 3133]|uniref:Winged helix-turn-helix domain-containing protein n=1 Tax=Actinotalea fermentans TaxID=43671 RepID=A0A511YX48_9CELL|nr:hypothetical protein N867_06890 [Actinotalea fermentans ATCC 43279 = JCM 9966 = DSM 3133]GEN79768.1 hypothetical protein AFE02nite_15020 [Actinotalea fermentans]